MITPETGRLIYEWLAGAVPDLEYPAPASAAPASEEKPLAEQVDGAMRAYCRDLSREEKEAMYTNAVSDTVAELLPILDNLQRAVDTSAETADAKTIADGVGMIAKLASDAFAKLGVEPIEAVGKEFDAAVHNAVMHVDDDSYGTNEVVEEFQKGYKCKDKVIRYSMVKVAN